MKRRKSGFFRGLAALMLLCLMGAGGTAAVHLLLERQADSLYRGDGALADASWQQEEADSYLSAAGRLQLLSEMALREDFEETYPERGPRTEELSREEAAQYASEFLYKYSQTLTQAGYPSRLGITEPQMTLRVHPEYGEAALWCASYTYEGAWLRLFLDARTGMPVRLAGCGTVRDYHEESQAICFLGRNIRKSDPLVLEPVMEYLEPFLGQEFMPDPVNEGYLNDLAYYFPSQQWITGEGEYALTAVGGQDREFQNEGNPPMVRFDMVVSPLSVMEECLVEYVETYVELRYFLESDPQTEDPYHYDVVY